MERQEFLKSLGISLAAVCVGACFSDCSKKNEPTPNPPPAGTMVSANLADLSAIGAKVIVSDIAFFRIAAGDTPTSFIAIQPLCTHQQGVLFWKADENLIQCERHSAQFNANGVNTRQPQAPGTAANLKTYVITVTGATVNAAV